MGRGKGNGRSDVSQFGNAPLREHRTSLPFAKPNLKQRFRKQSWQRQRLKELKERYSVNGNCPVLERTADGAFIGRCEFALRGAYCPRHGDLAGMLESGDYGGYVGIPEAWTGVPPERDLGPWPEIGQLENALSEK